jgi:hypothetical protein
LNYLVEYVENYQGLNKWAYLHSITGHEGSGSLVETLDRDLPDILTRLLETKDELVIFLMSDHGMRYGEWNKFMDGSQEHKLPVMHLIASSSLLRDLGSSLDILTHNARRLVSKLDLHRTLKHLTHVPYYRGYTRFSTAYSQWTAASEAAVSLLLEKVPNTRSCEDVLIPSFFCSCSSFKPVDLDRSPLKASVHFINFLALEVLSIFNEETRTVSWSNGYHVCAKLTLASIESAQYQVVSSSYYVYKLVLTVKESPQAVFEVMVAVLTQVKVNKQLPEFDADYKTYSFHSRGRKLIKVLQVKRNDAYGGLCEELSRMKGVSPPLCVCQSLDYIEYKEPQLLQTMEHKYIFAHTQPDQDCHSYCTLQGLNCDGVGMALVNRCSVLYGMSGCWTCKQGAEGPFATQAVCAVASKTSCAVSSKFGVGCACRRA